MVEATPRVQILKHERPPARRRPYGPLVLTLIVALLIWMLIALGGKILTLWLA